jgi:hypothetical protein
MNFKISFSLKFLLILIISGCGETNYLLTSDTPQILEGFYGFRWTTPMSVVDSDFPKRTGATPIDSLNRYNTSNFSEAYFLGGLTSLCQFTFNETGLISVKMVFNTNQMTFEDELFKLKEKLTDVYGEPREALEIIDYRTLPEYLIRYFWAESRLDITLKLDYTVEINAFSFSPLLGPIFNK